MPRTTKEILEHADELARQFEEHEPDPARVREAQALARLRELVLARSAVERDLVAAVAAAREEGHSWSAIGAMLGTSGEAARQRYGRDPVTP